MIKKKPEHKEKKEGRLHRLVKHVRSKIRIPFRKKKIILDKEQKTLHEKKIEVVHIKKEPEVKEKPEVKEEKKETGDFYSSEQISETPKPKPAGETKLMDFMSEREKKEIKREQYKEQVKEVEDLFFNSFKQHTKKTQQTDKKGQGNAALLIVVIVILIILFLLAVSPSIRDALLK